MYLRAPTPQLPSLTLYIAIQVYMDLCYMDFYSNVRDMVLGTYNFASELHFCIIITWDRR